jgi:hypothetical protein
MQYPQHDLTRLTHQGLEAKEIFSPSGRGRKMPLTSPLIDQAWVLKKSLNKTPFHLRTSRRRFSSLGSTKR